MTNRINDFNANKIFLFELKIKYSISIKKHKQNQDREQNNNLKKKKKSWVCDVCNTNWSTERTIVIKEEIKIKIIDPWVA